MDSMKNSAEEIKRTQEATIYGVSYCAIHIFELLLSEKGQEKLVSVLIPEELQKELGAPGIFLSLYSRINQHGALPTEAYRPDEAEMAGLRKSVNLMLPCIPQKYL
jgi:malate/lactate dehydrogenase